MNAADNSSGQLSKIEYGLIHKNVGNRIQLDEQELDYFDSVLECKSILKRGVLLQEGQLCRYLNYVHTGALRAYTLDKQGKEATVMFALPDWWITDMYCFLNEKPAMMYIEAIEDSFVFQISKSQMDERLRKVPKFE